MVGISGKIRRETNHPTPLFSSSPEGRLKEGGGSIGPPFVGGELTSSGGAPLPAGTSIRQEGEDDLRKEAKAALETSSRRKNLSFSEREASS